MIRAVISWSNTRFPSFDKNKLTRCKHLLFPLLTKLTFLYLMILKTLRKQTNMCIMLYNKTCDNQGHIYTAMFLFVWLDP